LLFPESNERAQQLLFWQSQKLLVTNYFFRQLNMPGIGLGWVSTFMDCMCQTFSPLSWTACVKHFLKHVSNMQSMKEDT